MDRCEQEIQQFLSYMTVERGLSPNTLSNYGRDLRQCAATLRRRDRTTFCDATYADLIEYLTELRHRGLTTKTISRRQYCLRSFFRFLKAEGLLEENPALRIEPIKTWATLPEVLTAQEVERLLAHDSRDSPYALRTRAILELLYATGIRVSELTHLRVSDLHADVGHIQCIGKGNKQRLVPVVRSALETIAEWMELGRSKLVPDAGSEWLFVNRGGTRMARQQVWFAIKKRCRDVGIERNVSPHTFRHSFATHLLQRGMDLRALQEMLGHADVVTTQFYTKVEPEHLKDAHRRFHPRA